MLNFLGLKQSINCQVMLRVWESFTLRRGLIFTIIRYVHIKLCFLSSGDWLGVKIKDGVPASVTGGYNRALGVSHGPVYHVIWAVLLAEMVSSRQCE